MTVKFGYLVSLECPHCGAKYDGVGTEDQPRTPRSGDVIVCVECSALLLFVDDACTMRLPTVEDLKHIDPVLLQRAYRDAAVVRREKDLRGRN